METRRQTPLQVRNWSEVVSCAEAVARILSTYGPPVIFGYPGAHTVLLHAAIAREPRLRHVLVRHEQGAAFAADGYARASGRVGVFLTTAGPGATNALTGVAESFTNSVPVVHICCLVDRPFVGKSVGAWHEADVEAIFRPITKWQATAKNPHEAPELVRYALGEAARGRPRPVQVCLPRDLLAEPVTPNSLRPETEPSHDLDTQAIRDAARLIGEAKRPVIMAGGGSVSATRQVRTLAALLQGGVATTCMGKGVYPDDGPLALGVSFSDAACTALQEADLCVAIGCRFTQIATRNWTIKRPPSLIHIDVDSSVIGMHYPPRVSIVGAAAQALEALLEELSGLRMEERREWTKRIRDLRERDRNFASDEAQLCRLLRRAIPREAVVVGDVASLVYRMFVHFECYEPATLLYPAGYIAMGYGLPAAIGAAFARPEAPVICITGDGSFQMSMMELATAVQNQIPAKVIVLNNGCLGSIARFAGNERADLEEVVRLNNPDFLALARAYQIPGDHAQGDDQQAIERCLGWLLKQEGPALLEVKFPSL